MEAENREHRNAPPSTGSQDGEPVRKRDPADDKMSSEDSSSNPVQPPRRRGLACRNCAAREACTDHAQRFLRGYELPPAGRALLRSWRRTRPVRSLATALADVAALHVLIAVHLILLDRAPVWLGVLTYPAVLVLIARVLRGLEVLVHEGSHFNWTRHRSMNDRMVNGFAAFAVFQTVQGFRVEHAVHHKHLGSEHDPCRRRYIALGWDRLSRASAAAYLRGMAGRLGRYSASWWKLVGGNRGVMVRGAAWHMAVVVLPLTVALTLRGDAGLMAAGALALLAWAAYVGVSFVVVLPPMRFVAEAAKHDYVGGTTTKTGTLSNVGPVHWMLHPHGDGYHFLHHVDANIPHHHLGRVHRWLTLNDPEYASSRQRLRVLEEVPLYSISTRRSL